MMTENFDTSLFRDSDTVLVALSGGADSVCLLLNLFEMKEKSLIKSLSAIHCNHGLRGDDAVADEEFCRRLCKRLGVEFFCENIPVKDYAKEHKMSLEEAGRILRYEAFDKHCKGGLVATAHNKNDNAETVIFNLTRGTSLKGMCGIPKKRGNIVRPLLTVSREEIERYLLEKDEGFVTDKTNLKPDFSRNRIRLCILPEMKKLNEKAVENISLFAESASIDEDFLQKEAEKLLNKAKISDNVLDRDVLFNAHGAILGRALKKFLEDKGFSPDRHRLFIIMGYIKNGDGFLNLSNEAVLSVDRKKLSVIFKKSEIMPYSVPFSLGEVKLPHKKAFFEIYENTDKTHIVHKKFTNQLLDYDTIKGTILIRNRREGDRITLCGRDFEHRVKKLFENIPKGEKSKRVLLSDDDGVIFVEGFGVADRVKITDKTKTILEIRIEED